MRPVAVGTQGSILSALHQLIMNTIQRLGVVREVTPLAQLILRQTIGLLALDISLMVEDVSDVIVAIRTQELAAVNRVHEGLLMDIQ
jgi:hypothetical protein